MFQKSGFTLLAVLVAAGSLTGSAFAKGGGGGGGGGGATVVLPPPPIPASTFDGIGPGPTYIHESFGHTQRTRYKQDGTVVDVVNKPEINGIRAEYPNNKTESWIAGTAGPSFKLSGVGPADPYEPFSPLQAADFGTDDGLLIMVGAEIGTDTRPTALIPFPAPAGSASTVSADTVAFNGKSAIGFSTSSATARNFESNGQAWLETDTSGNFGNGGFTGILKWTFHTDGLSGTTLSGTYNMSPNGFNRLAVSYDPVDHVAAATIDGNLVASVPYTAASIKYAGVEGTFNGNVDNFTVRSGTV